MRKYFVHKAIKKSLDHLLIYFNYLGKSKWSIEEIMDNSKSISLKIQL